MIYGYEIDRSSLTDDELDCLGDGFEVFSFNSPREIEQLQIFDCIFPSGDISPKTKEAINPASCVSYY